MLLMKKKIFVFAVGLLVVLGAASAFADTGTYLTLTSAGNNVMDGVYVGPYYATITQNNVPQYNQQVICDDFSDESYVGHTWSATVNTFATLSNTLWGQQLISQYGQTQGLQTAYQLYGEAATLAFKMLSLPSSQQGLYSFAIWAIFNPNGVKNQVSGSEWTQIQALIAGVQNLHFDKTSFANLLIFTPTNNGIACGVGNCPAQEFFVFTPEGGTALAYLLLAGLSCMLAMRFRVRRGHVA